MKIRIQEIKNRWTLNSLSCNYTLSTIGNKLQILRMRMKTSKSLYPPFFYGIAIILFFIDFASFSLFEKPFIYSLLCFYLLQLATPLGLRRIFTSCLLLSLPPIIHYGCFGLELIYLVPATLAGIKMRQWLYNSYWQYYLLLACCLLAQIVIIEYGILHLTISIPYTISTLFVNLIIIWIMSYCDIWNI